VFIYNSGHAEYVTNEVGIRRSALQSKFSRTLCVAKQTRRQCALQSRFAVGGNWERTQSKNYVGNVGKAYNMTVALQSQVALCNEEFFLLIAAITDWKIDTDH